MSTATTAELLKGIGVVSFESRMATEMTKLIAGFGGQVISAPSMQEIPLEKNRDALEFAEKLMAGKIDMTIFLTGVGTRALFETVEKRYPREEMVRALSSTVVVARGPKPTRVLREYGITPSVTVPEPNTWREMVHEIDENEESLALAGKTVALQEYGEKNDELIEALQRRKAHVLRVPVYRWALPDDIAPLKDGIRAVIDGRAQIALFTNKVQVDHVMRIATEEGLAEKLKAAFKSIVVASVGPLCTEGLLEHGISVDLEPTHPKMGSFVMETAKHAPEILHKKRTSVSVHSPADVYKGPDRGFSPEALAASPFMKACRREATSVTPVWLMRQAGRYMKEYREIRRKLSFLDFCRDKDLVTQVTVQAQEYLGADAAIIFSDILLVVQSFGMDLEFAGDEGPVIGGTLGEGKAKFELREPDLKASLGFVLDAIRQTRRALKKDVPLLGFAGAPFTLASYMIEGGASKTFRRTKMWMYSRPADWDILMTRLADAVGKYLVAQVDAGAQAVQLFDSWVGCLGPQDYEQFVAPYTRRIVTAVAGKAPLISFGTGNPALLEPMTAVGGDVIGVDYRIGLAEAWRRIGPSKAVQGNLDPLVLCADRDFIKAKVTGILAEAAGRPGHIFNLGHGILPETPPENAKYLVEIVHELSANRPQN